MNVRPPIYALTQENTSPGSVSGEVGELISVSSATKRIAFAYERFRNTLEPDEEDILRRKAIYRILERRLAEDRPPLVTATSLIQELIRAHYVQPVGATHAARIAERLVRTGFVASRLDEPVLTWFLRIAAVSIDREFYPRQQEESLVHVMYEDVLARTVWTDELVKEADRPTQLYIACHRSLFAADDFEIAYHYFIHHFPQWNAAELSVEDIALIGQQLPEFYAQITRIVHHPARDRLTRIMRSVAVPYRLLRDIVRDSANAFSAPPALEEATRAAVTKRTKRIRERMNKRAWHSILFLFITKTIIAIIIELPYEIVFLGGAQWFALMVNTAFHPLLLFVLATSARLPGQRNADRLVDQVRTIVTGDEELPTVVISEGRHYGALTWSVFALFYVALFMVIFLSPFRVLDALHFSLLAMFLFVVFLGLVSFLAIRIRRSTDQIRVLPKKEGALSTLFSFLTLPVLEFGRWLAQNISQINIALFLMDRVLEAPFKLLIDVIEEWFDFVRERREEIT